MTNVVVCIYNLAVLAGTAWLVHHGWSGWWFLFALLCLMRTYNGGDK